MLCSIQGRFLMTEQAARYFEPFDLDVTLRDAALDDQNRPTRRMLANAAIGMHVEDAYYSVRELRSEEHTSELQSLMRISYAVFCLKKKNNYTERYYSSSQHKNNISISDNLNSITNFTHVV